MAPLLSPWIIVGEVCGNLTLFSKHCNYTSLAANAAVCTPFPW
jgi:hypothetical protein